MAMLSTTYPGYTAIIAKAEELGWPIRFRDDLYVYDQETLTVPNAPQVFGWGIRATGTDLYLPNHPFSLDWAIALKKNAYEGRDRIFWYKDEHLKEITLDQLIHRLAKSIVLTEHQGSERYSILYSQVRQYATT